MALRTESVVTDMGENNDILVRRERDDVRMSQDGDIIYVSIANLDDLIEALRLIKESVK